MRAFSVDGKTGFRLFRSFSFALVFVLAASATVHAQELPESVNSDQIDNLRPAGSDSQLAEEAREHLRTLFTRLKRERNEKAAERIAEQIWRQWRKSRNHSVDLLAHWAREAMEKKKYAASLDLLDQIVLLEPAFAEGWNQRATVHYLLKDYGKSVADIERTLALEPRHFGALSGLANIQQILGRKKAALAAWKRALEIYPSMKTAQSAVIRLEEELIDTDL